MNKRSFPEAPDHAKRAADAFHDNELESDDPRLHAAAPALQFATAERHRALGYLKAVYPSSDVFDTPESAGPMLDLVDNDIIRIQDPMMYGNSPQVVPGTNWDESKRGEVADVCASVHKTILECLKK